MPDYANFVLQIRRGDHRTVTIRVTEPDGVTPRDITGWQLWLTAKRALADADTAADAIKVSTLAGSITITNAAQGQAEAAILPSHTEGLPASEQTFYVDLQAKDATGKIGTLRAGKLVVQPDVTQAVS